MERGAGLGLGSGSILFKNAVRVDRNPNPRAKRNPKKR